MDELTVAISSKSLNIGDSAAVYSYTKGGNMIDSIINIFVSGVVGIGLYYAYQYFEKFLGDGKK